MRQEGGESQSNCYSRSLQSEDAIIERRAYDTVSDITNSTLRHYDRIDFNVPVGRNGDCYDRYLLRAASSDSSDKGDGMYWQWCVNSVWLCVQALDEEVYITHTYISDQV